MPGHDPGFWAGRRVFMTGHTGFKGSWLATYLVDLGAELLGLSLPDMPPGPNLWDALDLSEVDDMRADVAGDRWQDRVLDFSPQVILHLAAQSLVRVGYEDPLTTFRTNMMGTVQVLSLIERLPDLEAALIVTTDKVYDVRQQAPYVEDDFLGGGDPYSASKAAADLATAAWPLQGSRCATARSGNVIGGGDWSRDRIVPDAIRAWSAGAPLVLRRPEAVRPWQHVIEPLVGYLASCEALSSTSPVPPALNFGPGPQDAVTVGELVSHAAEEWRARFPGTLVSWSVERDDVWHETGTLTLDASASRAQLGLTNRWTWREAVGRSIEWYARAAAGEYPRDLVREQFASYLSG